VAGGRPQAQSEARGGLLPSASVNADPRHAITPNPTSSNGNPAMTRPFASPRNSPNFEALAGSSRRGSSQEGCLSWNNSARRPYRRRFLNSCGLFSEVEKLCSHWMHEPQWSAFFHIIQSRELHCSHHQYSRPHHQRFDLLPRLQKARATVGCPNGTNLRTIVSVCRPQIGV